MMLLMNRFVMFMWGLIIAGIMGIILVLGYNKRDKDYLSYISELKKASRNYMSSKNLTLKYNQKELIFFDDLVSEEFFKDDENKYCIESIIFTKGFLKDKFSLNIDDCKKEEDIKKGSN